MSVIPPLLFKRQCHVKPTTALSLCATLPRQTAPGWAIAAELQEHRPTGTLNQEQRAFPPFTEEQGLKNHSPRNSWKDFLERCRNEIQESFQEDTWPLQAFLGHTPWLVWIAVTTQSFTCFCWTNPEFPPWPVPKYIYVHLRPCTTPLLSHIPFAPAAKGSAPATRCQQHSSDLQSFPNQLPCNVQLPLFITPTNSNATHQGPQINSSTAMQYLST